MNHQRNGMITHNAASLQKRKMEILDDHSHRGPSSSVNSLGPSMKIARGRFTPYAQERNKHAGKSKESNRERFKNDHRKIKSSGHTLVSITTTEPKEIIKGKKKEVLTEHFKTRNAIEFPRIHDCHYIIPPLAFYRPALTLVQIGDHVTVYLLTPSKQLSDIRESEAENRVVRAITTLLRTGQHGAMVVVRNIVFDNYLNFSGRFPSRKLSTEHVGNSSGATESAETETYVSDDVLPEGFCQSDYGLFPRPRDQSSELQRGSFDILIISKKYGLIICETKAVGDTFGAAPEGTTKQFEHESITKRISKALKQLDKESRVLAYLVSDVDPQLRSCRVLVLPNLSRDTLRDVLKVEHKLREEFCRCMGADGDLDMALKKCIFSEHLPPIGKALEADDSINDNLKQWWTTLTAGGTGHEMKQKTYELLLARFCSPATSLHVPTASQSRADVRTYHNAVYETLRCMKANTLYPEQFQLLQSKEERVFLTGPPGTGKTAMLKLRGIQWSSEGHVVYVISLWTGSEAVSYSICEEIKQHLPTTMDSNNVQLLLNRKPKFKDVLDPLIKHRKDLTEKGTKNYRLHLIIDEATWYLGFFVQTLERELQGFGLTHLSLWAASTFHGFKPKSFKEMKMTRSIRCPPAVVREIQKGGAYAMRAVYPYPDLDAGVLSSQPPPTDGPPVKRIEHDRDHKGDVWDCETCGEELARFLKDDLQIGSVTSQDRLKFSHVFVSGHVRFPPPGALTGFLKGLSVTGGVPYDVIRKEDGFYTEKLAHPTDDKVQLVHPACLVGLERPVVVFIGTNDLNATNPNYVDPWCDVVSRCQAQLVVIEDVDVSMVRGMDRFSVN